MATTTDNLGELGVGGSTQYNNKEDFHENGYVYANWTHLSDDRVQLQALLNTKINLRVK
jgi:hypothetical protein